MERKQRRRETIIPNSFPSKMENEGGGNKGKEIQEEILVAYNRYLQARYFLKLQENNMEEVECNIKKKQLELEKQEDLLEQLRRRRIEIQYLATTSKVLDVLKEALQSLLKAYPAVILDELHQIRNGLEHNANQLPVKGATVAPDESEQIMKILPHFEQTLTMFQNAIGDQGELHAEVSNIITALVKSISGIMAVKERCNDMIDEMVPLGLLVAATNVLSVRQEE